MEIKNALFAILILMIFSAGTASATTPFTCSDSDGGGKLYNKGITQGTNSDGTPFYHEDYCLSETQIREYWCEDEQLIEKDFDCRNYYWEYCYNGVCVHPEIEEHSITNVEVTPEGALTWIVDRQYDQWKKDGMSLQVEMQYLQDSGKYKYMMPCYEGNTLKGTSYDAQTNTEHIAQTSISGIECSVDSRLNTYFVTDSTGSSTDAITQSSLISYLNNYNHLDHGYTVKLNHEITKNDLEDRLTVFLYNDQWVLIVGVHAPTADVQLAANINSWIYGQGYSPSSVYSYVSNEVTQNDLKALLGTCSDTDGGVEYYTPGTVTVSNTNGDVTYDDFCSGSTLVEFSCHSTSALALNYTYSCEHGCSNGACNQESAREKVHIVVEDEPTPNDDEKQAELIDYLVSNGYMPQGYTIKYDSQVSRETIKDRITVFTSYGRWAIILGDQAADEDSQLGMQIKNWVKNNYPNDIRKYMSSSMVESDDLTSIFFCKEDDNGLDYYKQSAVYDGASYFKEDYCQSETTLVEYQCTGDTSYSYSTYVCPSGCAHGACEDSPSATQVINIEANKWDWISFYVLPESRTVRDTLGDIPSSMLIKTGDGDNEQRYRESTGEYDFTTLDYFKSYRVLSDEDLTITVHGKRANFPKTIELKKYDDNSLNYIGFPYDKKIDTKEFFAPIMDKIEIIKGYSGFFDPGIIETGLTELEPGEGYVVAVKEDVSFTYYEDPTGGPSCSDTDGGANPDKKGTITGFYDNGNSFSNTDYCQSTKSLVEYYCNGQNRGIKILTCENECVDGRCTTADLERYPSYLVIDRNAPAETVHTITKIAGYIDSNNLAPQGYESLFNDEVTKDDLKKRLTVFLHGSNLAVIRGELSHNEDINLARTIAAYASQELNLNVKQIMDTDVNSDNLMLIFDDDTNQTGQYCIDRDGGKDYYTGSYVKTGVVNEAARTFYDYCSTSQVVSEYYCRGNDKALSTYTCKYGCDNGACRSAPQSDTINVWLGKQFMLYPGATAKVQDHHNMLIELTGFLDPGENPSDPEPGDGKLLLYQGQTKKYKVAADTVTVMLAVVGTGVRPDIPVAIFIINGRQSKELYAGDKTVIDGIEITVHELIDRNNRNDLLIDRAYFSLKRVGASASGNQITGNTAASSSASGGSGSSSSVVSEPTPVVQSSCPSTYTCPDGSRVPYCHIVSTQNSNGGGAGCACRTNPQDQCIDDNLEGVSIDVWLPGNTQSIILHRDHLYCSNDQPVAHAPNGGLNQVFPVGPGTNYWNYKCKNRKQEQCYDDGSFDAYYREWCEYPEESEKYSFDVKVGQKINIFGSTIHLLDVIDGKAKFKVELEQSQEMGVDVGISPRTQTVQEGQRVMYDIVIKDKRTPDKCPSGKCGQSYVTYTISVLGLPFQKFYDTHVKLAAGEKKRIPLEVLTAVKHVTDKDVSTTSISLDVLESLKQIEFNDEASAAQWCINNMDSESTNVYEACISKARIKHKSQSRGSSGSSSPTAGIITGNVVTSDSIMEEGASEALTKVLPNVNAYRFAVLARSESGQSQDVAYATLGVRTKPVVTDEYAIVKIYEESDDLIAQRKGEGGEDSGVADGGSASQRKIRLVGRFLLPEGRKIVFEDVNYYGFRNSIVLKLKDIQSAGSAVIDYHVKSLDQTYSGTVSVKTDDIAKFSSSGYYLEALAVSTGSDEPPEFPDVVEEEISIELEPGWNLVSLSGNKLTRFISTDCSTQINKLVAFVYLKDEKKYVSMSQARNILGDKFYDYLSRNAFWVYSYSECKLIVGVETYLGYNELSLSEGWNMVPVTADMIGKTLSEVASDCRFKQVYYWDAAENKWEQISGNYRFNQNMRYKGFAANVNSYCQLGGSLALLEPPLLPNEAAS